VLLLTRMFCFTLSLLLRTDCLKLIPDHGGNCNKTNSTDGEGIDNGVMWKKRWPQCEFVSRNARRKGGRKRRDEGIQTNSHSIFVPFLHARMSNPPSIWNCCVQELNWLRQRKSKRWSRNWSTIARFGRRDVEW